jgi:hypothetical protein
MTGDETTRLPKIPADLPAVTAVEEEVAAAESAPPRRPAPTPTPNGDRAARAVTAQEEIAEPEKIQSLPRTPAPEKRMPRERGDYPEPPPPLDDDPERLERARRSFEEREAELAKVERDRAAVGGGREAAEKAKKEEFVRAELRTAAEAVESVRRALVPTAAGQPSYVDLVEHLREAVLKAEKENRETIVTLRHDLERAKTALKRAKRKQLTMEQAVREEEQRAEALSEALHQVQLQHGDAIEAVRQEAHAHWRAREQALLRQTKKDLEAFLNKIEDPATMRLAHREMSRTLDALSDEADDLPRAGSARRRRVTNKARTKRTSTAKRSVTKKPAARKRAPRER